VQLIFQRKVKTQIRSQGLKIKTVVWSVEFASWLGGMGFIKGSSFSAKKKVHTLL
jgi:hypothetical protein